MQKILFGLITALVTGCSYIGSTSSTDNTINIAEIQPISFDAAKQQNTASIFINNYSDTRIINNPRKIGTGAMNVFGLRGKDIILNQDVAKIVMDSMRHQFIDIGFPVSMEQSSNALFELSGVIKEFSYDVKARDEVSMSIETTLKEIGTGKIVWSGLVVEKNERFAGVSGNNKEDVANFLSKELDIITAKTAQAIRTSLVETRPELFQLSPVANTVPGVTVMIAPSPTTPMHKPITDATHGQLLISTHPARAKIYLDDVFFGISPLHLELASGVYTVNVKLEGYKMVMERVSVRMGDRTEMELNLER